MITLLVIAFTLFWILAYFIEGSHDGALCREKEQVKEYHNPKLANYYNGRWHTIDSYLMGMFHLAIAYLFIILCNQQNIILFAVSCWYSVTIRIICHDMFVDMYRGRPFNSYPSKDGDWDWWDGLLLWLKSKGIEQYWFKGILFVSALIGLVLIIL